MDGIGSICISVCLLVNALHVMADLFDIRVGNGISGTWVPQAGTWVIALPMGKGNRFSYPGTNDTALLYPFTAQLEL